MIFSRSPLSLYHTVLSILYLDTFEENVPETF